MGPSPRETRLPGSWISGPASELPPAQCWGDWGGKGVAGRGQAQLFHFSLQTSKAFTTIAFPTLSCFLHGLLVKVKSLSRVRLFMTPWTIAYQSPPSMGFSRLEHWSGLPFPSPRVFPTQGLNPVLPHCWQTLYSLNHP